MNNSKKLLTIDEYYNRPAGSFIKSIKFQEELLLEQEKERIKRIRQVRCNKK